MAAATNKRDIYENVYTAQAFVSETLKWQYFCFRFILKDTISYGLIKCNNTCSTNATVNMAFISLQMEVQDISLIISPPLLSCVYCERDMQSY